MISGPMKSARLLPWTPKIRFVSWKFILLKEAGMVTKKREIFFTEDFHNPIEFNLHSLIVGIVYPAQ